MLWCNYLMNYKLIPQAVLLLLVFSWPASVDAYAGLGPMVPLVGNGIIILFALGITVFGFLAYPLLLCKEKFSNKKKKPVRKKKQP